jgi:uroporphyrinogen III methyltransferase/synthase
MQVHDKPLQGQSVLITRAAEGAVSFADRLRRLGAEPIICPTITVQPPEDYGPLDRALQQLDQDLYAWAIFTSVNGVRFTWDRAHLLSYGAHIFESTRLAAIGPATARALIERGLSVDYLPPEYLAEAIAEGLGDLAGARVLLPRAQIARRTLAERLRIAGAKVDEVTAYRTLPAGQRLNPKVGALLARRDLDWLTFTSASTVRHFVQLVQQENLDPTEALRGTNIACIGSITAQEAHALGLTVDVIAQEHTIGGLIEALVRHVQGEPIASH